MTFPERPVTLKDGLFGFGDDSSDDSGGDSGDDSGDGEDGEGDNALWGDDWQAEIDDATDNIILGLEDYAGNQGQLTLLQKYHGQIWTAVNNALYDEGDAAEALYELQNQGGDPDEIRAISGIVMQAFDDYGFEKRDAEESGGVDGPSYNLLNVSPGVKVGLDIASGLLTEEGTSVLGFAGDVFAWLL